MMSDITPGDMAINLFLFKLHLIRVRVKFKQRIRPVLISPIMGKIKYE